MILNISISSLYLSNPYLDTKICFKLCTAAQWVALIIAFSLYWALGRETWTPFGKWDNNKAAAANNGGFSTSHPGTVKSLYVVYVVCVYSL